MTIEHHEGRDDAWLPIPFAFHGTEQQLIEVVDRCISGLPGKRDIRLPLSKRPEAALHVKQTAAHVEEFIADTKWAKELGVTGVLFVRMVWIWSKKLSYVEPLTSRGLMSISYSYFSAIVPAPEPIFVTGELADHFGSERSEGPTVKIVRIASDHLDCTVEAVPLLAFARDAILYAVAKWNEQRGNAIAAQVQFDPDQNIFLCDIETIQEVYNLLPHDVQHRDQKWVVGPINRVSEHYWTIAVYELGQGGRKRRQGEIQLMATLAGLKVGLAPGDSRSAVARAAATCLLQEIRFMLGLDQEEHGAGQSAMTLPLDELSTVETPNRRWVLSGKQVKEMCAVLEEAFEEWQLRQLVRVYLDENFDAIAGGKNIREKISALVSWAEKTYKVDQLLDGAIEENPSNQRLMGFVKSLRH